MRYPTANTKADFDRDWRVDQAFGIPTSYGFHEGVDINLKTGGDTDLGRELQAIAAGKIEYYHNGHPTANFGKHLAYKIVGAWGTRWVHYAHCMEQTFTIADVAEGQVIAKIGKTGNSPNAHLHMSIFKVDPLTVGLDNVANTMEELNAIYEDPMAFLAKWVQAPAPVDYKKLYEDKLVINGKQAVEISALKSQLAGKDAQIIKFKLDMKKYVEEYQI